MGSERSLYNLAFCCPFCLILFSTKICYALIYNTIFILFEFALIYSLTYVCFDEFDEQKSEKERTYELKNKEAENYFLYSRHGRNIRLFETIEFIVLEIGLNSAAKRRGFNLFIKLTLETNLFQRNNITLGYISL